MCTTITSSTTLIDTNGSHERGAEFLIVNNFVISTTSLRAMEELVKKASSDVVGEWQCLAEAAQSSGTTSPCSPPASLQPGRNARD